MEDSRNAPTKRSTAVNETKWGERSLAAELALVGFQNCSVATRGAESSLGNLAMIIGATLSQVGHQCRDGMGEALHVSNGSGPAVAESALSDIAHAWARA